MQSRFLRIFCGLLICSLGIVTASRGDSTDSSQHTPAPGSLIAPPTPTPVTPPPPAPVQVPAALLQPPVSVTNTRPLDLLVWDAIFKEQSPLPNQPTADFVFKVNNPSESNVVITDVHTSCGCTVATLPSKPWVLAPHTNGEIGVKVNLAGKSGTFFKTVTIMSSNDTKLLTIKINLPESPAMVRERNQQLAFVDPQGVFKGECAKCHFDTAKGKMGKDLYIAACSICHDAKPRATMVTDLRQLKHPTDYAFWKQIVTDGKPKTIMPAFAAAHGGPLNDDQIESLAKFLVQEYPSVPTYGIPMATGIGQPVGTPPAIKN